MTLVKDLAWVALIVLLLPVIMAVAFVAVVVILARSLYRWAQGNLTSTSRSAAAAEGPLPLSAAIPVPAYAADVQRRPR
jgi:hypothetical protein